GVSSSIWARFWYRLRRSIRLSLSLSSTARRWVMASCSCLSMVGSSRSGLARVVEWLAHVEPEIGQLADGGDAPADACLDLEVAEAGRVLHHQLAAHEQGVAGQDHALVLEVLGGQHTAPLLADGGDDLHALLAVQGLLQVAAGRQVAVETLLVLLAESGEQGQVVAGLAHCLGDQYAGHDRAIGEVPG